MASLKSLRQRFKYLPREEKARKAIVAQLSLLERELYKTYVELSNRASIAEASRLFPLIKKAAVDDVVATGGFRIRMLLPNLASVRKKYGEDRVRPFLDDFMREFGRRSVGIMRESISRHFKSQQNLHKAVFSRYYPDKGVLRFGMTGSRLGSTGRRLSEYAVPIQSETESLEFTENIYNVQYNPETFRFAANSVVIQRILPWVEANLGLTGRAARAVAVSIAIKQSRIGAKRYPIVASVVDFGKTTFDFAAVVSGQTSFSGFIRGVRGAYGKEIGSTLPSGSFARSLTPRAQRIFSGLRLSTYNKIKRALG